MTLIRHSSRRNPLDVSLLQARLRGAVGYDRTAGYFRSSLLEVAGEALETVNGPVRVLCNSDLAPEDVATARAAQQAQRQSWCAAQPERLADNPAGRARFGRLFKLLSDGPLQVRVLPDAATVESPIYRRELGLWAHQKYFIKLAFDAHRRDCARFVLADQVGLGKTVQLALAAALMALVGERPVLILVPKPLMVQWQEELRDLLGIPSARWLGDAWLDEQGITHPAPDAAGVRRCPRRFGIVSQGLITAGHAIADELLGMRFECVICDEAHRARRRAVDPRNLTADAELNNLGAFLLRLGARTKSLLLATATPVQLHPIEAWDLLNILAAGNDAVLGNDWSEWRKPARGLPVVMGDEALPEDVYGAWSWVRNPLPPATEGRNFRLLRQRLGLDDQTAVAAGDRITGMNNPTLTLLRQTARDFGREHNPFIRHIVRRTRAYLEETLDPASGEPFLKPVRVRLFGEGEDEAVILPAYLQDAYQAAEDFCTRLGERVRGAGFLKTLLLRRMGSSIAAGRRTTEKMLNTWGGEGALENAWAEPDWSENDWDENDLLEAQRQAGGDMKQLTGAERAALTRCLRALETNQDRDPKFERVLYYLRDQGWLEQGCILFTQYFDSAWWLAGTLSGEVLLEEPVGLYAGGARSGLLTAGQFSRRSIGRPARRCSRPRISVMRSCLAGDRIWLVIRGWHAHPRHRRFAGPESRVIDCQTRRGPEY